MGGYTNTVINEKNRDSYMSQSNGTNGHIQEKHSNGSIVNPTATTQEPPECSHDTMTTTEEWQILSKVVERLTALIVIPALVIGIVMILFVITYG